MESVKKILDYLINPFSIGVYITLFTLITANIYYNTDFSNPHESHGLVLSTLNGAQQKYIDHRLLNRGPRYGSDDVAILTVDERSLSEIGRWPWPRETIAKAIDKLIQLGAKVIAYDMVFSEESHQPLKLLYDSLDNKNLLTNKKIKNEIQRLKNDSDSDKIFSEIIFKNRDKLVMGTAATSDISNSSDDKIKMYQYCQYLVFKNSNNFEKWDKDISINVNDENEFILPENLEGVYSIFIQQISDDLTENNKMSDEPISQKDLSRTIKETVDKYCRDWPKKSFDYGIIKDSWAKLTLNEEDDHDDEYNAASYDEWINNLKNSLMLNPIGYRTDWLMSINQISQKTRFNGFFNAIQDQDGTIRRSALVLRTGNFYMPSIALQAYLTANDYIAEINLVSDVKNNLKSKKIKSFNILNSDGKKVFSVPVSNNSQMLIDYAGGKQMFPYLSISDLLNDKETFTITQSKYNEERDLYSPQEFEINKEKFAKGKYFLFGATALGIYDLRVTPFEKNYPGVETHANVLDNLIRQDFLKKYPDEDLYMYGFIIIVGLLTSFLLFKTGALWSFVSYLIALFAIYFIDKLYFFKNGFIITTVLPFFLMSGLFLIINAYKYFTEERKKKVLRGTFSKYVSPAIVDEILKDPANIDLGGRKERMTVFFSDIRGFTTISEALDPNDLSDLLNSYLSPMTNIIFENKGTLDKYMGDAIMAFFGAPIFDSNHAVYACRAALQNMAKLKELQEMYKQQNLPLLDIGIGLNTGDMSVGNMGSDTVRSYTVMGDSVNLGARLEGINKEYGTHIIISEFTFEDVKDHFTCRELDWVQVKGKTEPVRIYELICEGKTDEKNELFINDFDKGFKLYHEKNWKAALEQFEKCVTQKDDFTAKLYMNRCQGYIASPPDSDWDGVYKLTTK